MKVLAMIGAVGLLMIALLWLALAILPDDLPATIDDGEGPRTFDGRESR